MLRHKSSLFPGSAQLLVTFSVDLQSAKKLDRGLGTRLHKDVQYGLTTVVVEMDHPLTPHKYTAPLPPLNLRGGPPHKYIPPTLNAYLGHSKHCGTKVTAIDKHVHGSLGRTLHTNYVPSLQKTIHSQI